MATATMTQAKNPTDRMATLDYIRADSKINRRYMAAGKELNTGKYEAKNVFIRDARPSLKDFKLDTTGFQLVKHESKVQDWSDMSQLDSIYHQEIHDLVLNLTGAEKVIVFAPVRRNTSDKKQTTDNADGAWNDQPPASDVHVDYTPLRAQCLAQDFLSKNGLQGTDFQRYKFINLWRATSPGPQSWPLALCHGTSVNDDEGVINHLVYTDDVPDLDNLPAEIPLDDPMHPEGSLFTYRDGHQWYYFSDMKNDEVMLFTLYDSVGEKPWRVPHCAFLNKMEGTVPRESVEIRTVVFYK